MLARRIVQTEGSYMEDDIEDIFATDSLPEVSSAAVTRLEAKPVAPGRQTSVETTPATPSEPQVEMLGSQMKRTTKPASKRKILGMTAKERALASGLLFVLTTLIVLTVLASVGAVGA